MRKNWARNNLLRFKKVLDFLDKIMYTIYNIYTLYTKNGEK